MDPPLRLTTLEFMVQGAHCFFVQKVTKIVRGSLRFVLQIIYLCVKRKQEIRLIFRTFIVETNQSV